MSLKKYGSDPMGSELKKLSALEAESRLRSVTFGANQNENEEKEHVQIYEDKEWTPFDGKSPEES